MSENMKKKLAIFAAGTGGHVYPGISIANQLIAENIDIIWIIICIITTKYWITHFLFIFMIKLIYKLIQKFLKSLGWDMNVQIDGKIKENSKVNKIVLNNQYASDKKI